MAVYKATHCYPFMDGVDARVALHSDLNEKPVKYLTCKVDTSNKKVTGYRIHVYDNLNNRVYPQSGLGFISPLSEIQKPEFGYEEYGTNSGINGTMLNIPFFQNIHNPALKSFNAIYYVPKFLTDHVILRQNNNPSKRTLTVFETGDLLEGFGADNTQEIRIDWTKLTDAQLKAMGKTQEEAKLDNTIILDGEPLLGGETVAILDGKYIGIWKAELVPVDYTYTLTADLNGTGRHYETHLKKIYTFSTTDYGVVITVRKGETFHNLSWQYTNTKTFSIYTSDHFWKDVRNSPVNRMLSNGTSYKWKITLFQGDTPITTYPEYGCSDALYNNVDPRDYDMVLTSGRIMGTTPNRLQIASENSHTAILPNNGSEPIVLQGKFVSLLPYRPINTNVFPGTGLQRSYIETYDATLGHAYPRQDSINNIQLNSSEYCCFYKYSNNPKEILEGDIVDYDIERNVVISIKNVSGQTSVLSTYLEVGSLKDAAGNLVPEGSYILLSSQSNKEQNGVYLYYSVNADFGTGSSTTHWCIRRAPSYEDWSAYIGKVIYCKNTRTNKQCLARAGQYLLWNPRDTNSGSSKLIFVPERPVILFKSLIKNDNIFTLFDATRNRPSYTGNALIDGMQVQAGDKIIYRDGKYATVEKVSGQTYYFAQNYGRGQLDYNEYFYILDGEKFGEYVFRWNQNTDYLAAQTPACWDLHIARLMKNSTTRTFVTPFIDMENDMELRFLGNHYVPYNDGRKIPSKDLKAESYGSVIHCVDHQEIGEPFKSYDETDEDVPWQYEVRSFYRWSDENPFWSHEEPYIRLSKNGQLFSDLNMEGEVAAFYSQPQESSLYQNEKRFWVKVSEDSGAVGDPYERQFFISSYKAQNHITNRSVEFSGEYVTFTDTSVESYRWILYDENKGVLQDTGRRYDKRIAVTFYGLMNDLTEPRDYYAELIIEDSQNNTLRYIVSLQVERGNINDKLAKEGSNFTAVYDKDTYSVILSLPKLTDTPLSIYRREFEVFQKNTKYIEGYYQPIDFSKPRSTWKKFYKDPNFTEQITEKNQDYYYLDVPTNSYFVYDKQQDIFVPSDSNGVQVFRGEWEPVLLNTQIEKFRDYNVQADKTYQYIAYDLDQNSKDNSFSAGRQVFANFKSEDTGRKVWLEESKFVLPRLVEGGIGTSPFTGAPVTTCMPYWSIIELEPEYPEKEIEAPIFRGQYRVNSDKIWFFKYSLDVGSITQEFQREEIHTLGEKPQFGYGKENYFSGQVTALLGSEIIPGKKQAYIERLRQTRTKPETTNLKQQMLEEWRKFAYSRNPKLLRDNKGDSWIVQITQNSNTPSIGIYEIPDKISFSWKQVKDTDNIIIYGDYTEEQAQQKENYGKSVWSQYYRRH